MKTLPKFALALAAVASLVGCVSVPDNAGQDPSDPWEKMNRNTFAFNQKLDTYVYRPVAKGYEFVVPEYARERIGNIYVNLNEPANAINNALQGKALPVYGDGKNVRDWLYVMDHAKGIDMVQEKGRLFETYNIGGHNEKQNIQIIHIILDTLQEMLPEGDPRKELVSENLITYVEDRKGHDRRYAIAPDKIKAEIGWYPETDFATGIKKTIAWFFEHEDWMKNVTSGDYQKYYDDMYANK